MKIGIKFGDNDYGRTFEAALNILKDAWIYDSERVESLSKKQLLELFNSQLLPLSYNLFQSSGEKLTKTLYKQLIIANIFLNNEIEEFLIKYPHINDSDFFVLDTDLLYEGNNAILIY